MAELFQLLSAFLWSCTMHYTHITLILFFWLVKKKRDFLCWAIASSSSVYSVYRPARRRTQVFLAHSFLLTCNKFKVIWWFELSLCLVFCWVFLMQKYLCTLVKSSWLMTMNKSVSPSASLSLQPLMPKSHYPSFNPSFDFSSSHF